MSKQGHSAFHFQVGVLGGIRCVFALLKRRRKLTSSFEMIIAFGLTAVFLACDAGQLTAVLASTILVIASLFYGCWLGAINGSKAYIQTLLKSAFLALTIPQLFALLGKSHPQEDVSRFAGQMVVICTHLAFCAHMYTGVLHDVVMTREKAWQKGRQRRTQLFAGLKHSFRQWRF